MSLVGSMKRIRRFVKLNCFIIKLDVKIHIVSVDRINVWIASRDFRVQVNKYARCWVETKRIARHQESRGKWWTHSHWVAWQGLRFAISFLNLYNALSEGFYHAYGIWVNWFIKLGMGKWPWPLTQTHRALYCSSMYLITFITLHTYLLHYIVKHIYMIPYKKYVSHSTAGQLNN